MTKNSQPEVDYNEYRQNQNAIRLGFEKASNGVPRVLRRLRIGKEGTRRQRKAATRLKKIAKKYGVKS